jgi:hypothetical protein
MTAQIRDAILVLCGIGALALNFWTASKPVETKLVILRWLLEISCIAAIIAALYFALTADRSTLIFACAFYNLLVQGALFAISPLPTARREILSLVFAAVFFATIPMYTVTGVLAKAQSQLTQTQSRMIGCRNKRLA